MVRAGGIHKPDGPVLHLQVNGVVAADDVVGGVPVQGEGHLAAGVVQLGHRGRGGGGLPPQGQPGSQGQHQGGKDEILAQTAPIFLLHEIPRVIPAAFFRARRTK